MTRMEFRLKLEYAWFDNASGDIVVPVAVTPQPDTIWLKEVARRIDEYSREGRMDQPCFFGYVENPVYPAEMRIPPEYHGKITQAMLDEQKKLMGDLSRDATEMLAARGKLRDEKMKRMTEIARGVHGVIQNLRTLIG